MNILSFSGGKDSIASGLLLLENNISFSIVYSHFYFDKKKNIPAVLPEHYNFIFEKAFPFF